MSRVFEVNFNYFGEWRLTFRLFATFLQARIRALRSKDHAGKMWRSFGVGMERSPAKPGRD
jgi:hypothetical protein